LLIKYSKAPTHGRFFRCAISYFGEFDLVVIMLGSDDPPCLTAFIRGEAGEISCLATVRNKSFIHKEYYMSVNQDDLDRQNLIRSLEEMLEEPRAEWKRKFGSPENHATVGAILRVPVKLLNLHKVTPSSLCVLRIEGDQALLAPIRAGEMPAVGEVKIPPEDSPFGTGLVGGMIIELDATFFCPAVALQSFEGAARCDAVAALPEMSPLRVPPEKRLNLKAWKRFVASLATAD